MQAENFAHQIRIGDLEQEVRKLSGQQNLQQRIHHHAKIKVLVAVELILERHFLLLLWLLLYSSYQFHLSCHFYFVVCVFFFLNFINFYSFCYWWV
jgi:hypothetical protein